LSTWRDLPESYRPPTTYYNRFVRWRRAGVWDQIMDALATTHDAAVQMIDMSIVRVHQHGVCIAGNKPCASAEALEKYGAGRPTCYLGDERRQQSCGRNVAATVNRQVRNQNPPRDRA
jgi:hypothetical protein